MLWPWHRLAAVAPIQPLPRELPHASGTALKSVCMCIVIEMCIYNFGMCFKRKAPGAMKSYIVERDEEEAARKKTGVKMRGCGKTP